MSQEVRLRIEDPYIREQCTKQEVTTDHIKQYYERNISLPIEQLDPTPPPSYIKPLKELLSILQPRLTSGGTGEMFIDAITDIAVGGNINLHGILDESVEKELNSVIDKAVKLSQMFGNSIVIKMDGIFEIYDATCYYKEDDIIELCFPAIRDRKDVTLRVKLKQIEDNRYRVVEEETLGTGIIRKFRGKYVNVYEFVNNSYNHDEVGSSFLAPILKDIQSIDMTLHLYEKTMYYTKPRIHVSNELSEIDDNGEPTLNVTDDIYVFVDAMGIPEGKDPYNVTQFKLDQASYDAKIQARLSLALSKVGLDNRVLAWGNGNIERTATEIRSSDDRMINLVERIRNQYYAIITQLVKDSDDNAEINFTPTTYTSYENMVNSVVALKQQLLISDYTALKQLYPRWSEAQIQVELSELSGLSENDSTETYETTEEVRT